MQFLHQCFYQINTSMKIKYVLTVICLLSFVASSIAQDSKKLLCKILDQESKYPVSYATIKFEDIQNGVIADEEGEFRLPLEYKTSNKTIIISSIGFESLKISINTHYLDTFYNLIFKYLVIFTLYLVNRNFTWLSN